MIRHFGYCCMNLTLGDTKSRTIRLANFNLFAASRCAAGNVADLRRMVEWNAANGIKLFRIPSEIFPYADHPTAGYRLQQLDSYAFLKREFESIGKLARASGQRLTVHPGPFTTLSSGKPNYVAKSIRHLNHQSEMASWLATPDFAINIHVGRSYSEAAAATFVANFKLLSSTARSLLTVENDDKDGCWSVEDLVSLIHGPTGVPVVFDTHHWLFCHRSSLLSSAKLALSTWGSRIAKMHHSESREGSNPRAHSSYIENPVPEFDLYQGGKQLQYDVFLETKAKDLALLRYMKDHGHRHLQSRDREVVGGGGTAE